MTTSAQSVRSQSGRPTWIAPRSRPSGMRVRAVRVTRNPSAVRANVGVADGRFSSGVGFQSGYGSSKRHSTRCGGLAGTSEPTTVAAPMWSSRWSGMSTVSGAGPPQPKQSMLAGERRGWCLPPQYSKRHRSLRKLTLPMK